MTKQIISIISCLLGYQSNQWVDEAFIGFFSIFSIGEKTSIIFNYSEFLADAIHEEFLKFSIEGNFKYDLVLVFLFLYHQTNKC